MWNFQERIRKGMEFPGLTNQKAHRVSRGLIFGHWDEAHFYGITL